MNIKLLNDLTMMFLLFFNLLIASIMALVSNIIDCVIEYGTFLTFTIRRNIQMASVISVNYQIIRLISLRIIIVRAV